MCSYISDILGIEWQRLDLRARTRYRELSLGSDLLSSVLPIQYRNGMSPVEEHNTIYIQEYNIAI